MSGVEVAHAPLSPSGAARWVQCPGSIAMSAPFPDMTNEAASIGTLAHEFAAAVLTSASLVPEVDDEMRECVGEYVQAVHRVVRSQVEMYELHIEKRVSCAVIHPECWGTPDAWLFNRAKLELHVWDLKYGMGIVEPRENWQLMCYAAGILDHLGMKPDVLGGACEHVSLHLHIVQPRAFHRDGTHRTWSIPATSLRKQWSQMRLAAISAFGSNPPCKTGDECRYCPARHACPALLTVGYTAIDASGVSLPLDMSPQVMGMLLQQVRDGAARLAFIEAGLSQQIEAAIRSGKRVPGWNIVAGRGREKWRVPVEEVIALGEAMGVPLAKQSVITPKQAVDAGLPRDLVSSFTETPPGAVKLERDDGRLAAVFSIDTPVNKA